MVGLDVAAGACLILAAVTGDDWEADFMTIKLSELNEIDFSDVATGNTIESATPGYILKTEFLDPLGITQYRLALLCASAHGKQCGRQD
jgi:hypothetical protein